MKKSYIFLHSDVQLVMLALAIRVITLFQLELRAGQAMQGTRQQADDSLQDLFLCSRTSLATNASRQPTAALHLSSCLGFSRISAADNWNVV